MSVLPEFCSCAVAAIHAALDDSWSQRGGRQTGGAVVQSYEELVRNYVVSRGVYK